MSRTELRRMREYEFNGYSITSCPELVIYPDSVNTCDEKMFFIGREDDGKFLFVVYEKDGSNNVDDFEGEVICNEDPNLEIKKCPMNHANALSIKKLFPFTKPVLLGHKNSFGFGDRLGLANPGHLRALKGSSFKPIMAQQSIRELTRTKRTPEDVMDAAVWAVFQEGYKDGFGSDADHLKTTNDIDLMIAAGFTMFTFDPGDYVVNEADTESIENLTQLVEEMSWNELHDTFFDMMQRYEDKKFVMKYKVEIAPTREMILRAIVKYGKAIAHINKLYNYLVQNYSEHPFEIEVSIDETDSVTSPFEHYFIASELKRLKVDIVSLAPRFIGKFEKGIDYVGDLKIFKQEYLKHMLIAQHFGTYKLSLHSGSDKFGVYNVIGSMQEWFTHVKTAGTSYLEALRVVAAAEPDLFREILDYSREQFEIEKHSYHVSADSTKVLAAENYPDDKLLSLFNSDHARQVMHVTFGKVLTTLDKNGETVFKDRIFNCLEGNEDLHYKFLYYHFKRHLDPFKQ